MSRWFDCCDTPRDRKQGRWIVGVIIAAIVVCAFFLVRSTADAGEFKGTVLRVVDGDTLIIADKDLFEHTIRVLYVDTPESRRGTKATKDAEALGIDVEALIKAGKAASTFTGMMLDGDRRQVFVNVRGVDVYRRELAEVYIAGTGDLSSILVGNGMAKIYRRAAFPKSLEVQEAAAKKKRSGFWKTIWK